MCYCMGNLQLLETLSRSWLIYCNNFLSLRSILNPEAGDPINPRFIQIPESDAGNRLHAPPSQPFVVAVDVVVVVVVVVVVIVAATVTRYKMSSRLRPRRGREGTESA